MQFRIFKLVLIWLCFCTVKGLGDTNVTTTEPPKENVNSTLPPLTNETTTVNSSSKDGIECIGPNCTGLTTLISTTSISTPNGTLSAQPKETTSTPTTTETFTNTTEASTNFDAPNTTAPTNTTTLDNVTTTPETTTLVPTTLPPLTTLPSFSSTTPKPEENLYVLLLHFTAPCSNNLINDTASALTAFSPEFANCTSELNVTVTVNATSYSNISALLEKYKFSDNYTLQDIQILSGPIPSTTPPGRDLEHELTQQERIVLSTTGIIIGLLVTVGLSVFCLRRWKNRSDKGTIPESPPHSMRLEDYTLTRIPRPSTVMVPADLERSNSSQYEAAFDISRNFDRSDSRSTNMNHANRGGYYDNDFPPYPSYIPTHRDTTPPGMRALEYPDENDRPRSPTIMAGNGMRKQYRVVGVDNPAFRH